MKTIADLGQVGAHGYRDPKPARCESAGGLFSLIHMNIPQPLSNESQEDFIVRAHRELMTAVPEPMERNRVVWDAWDAIHGNVERERAEQLFPEDQFQHKRDVCLWHEHEAESVGPDGQPTVKRNDVHRLASIVRENNLRIADTDAYTALVDKHTLPPGMDDKHKDKPRTVGYVGPFRLGMIGRVQPKFAIFADEHHRRDKADVLSDRPRRSVEVLTLRANGRSYIDPVAALSEAPRLPLPVQFAAEFDDGVVTVDRYQAEPVAAYPGGGNTYIPGGNGRHQQSEQFGSSPADDHHQSETDSMLQPEDLKQIADAIMSTPQMQFVSQLMQSQGIHQPSPNGQQPNGQQPGGMPPGQKEPYLAPALAAGLAGAAGGMVANRFGAGNDDGTETERYEIVNSDDGQDGDLAERYAALAESQGNLMKKVSELATRNAALEAKAADAERRTRLNELYTAHPHMVDLESELQRCLYSAGSTMDDDAFESHCELVEQYASRAPAITPIVPDGTLPQPKNDRVKREQYQAEIASRSLEIYNAAMESGESKTADQCWAEAEREISPAA